MNNNRVIEKLAYNMKYSLDRQTVFIIGAGVSYEAAGLPLGQDLAWYFVKELGCDSGTRKQMFTSKLDYLESEYNFDRNDFKTILFALNMIDSACLMDLAVQSLSSKSIYTNSEIYKLIAEMFSEKKIDHIINFNFDELLEEELLGQVKSDHIQVNSDHDLINHDVQNLSVPIYIKPHGTISAPKTIRFQREDYYKLEDKIYELLKKKFCDKPLDLVVIGFRLKFHEFDKLVNQWMRPTSNIYIINENEDVIGNNLRNTFYNGDFIEISKSFSLEKTLRCLKSAMSLSPA